MTDKQREILPQLLRVYIERMGVKGVEALCDALSEGSQQKVYELCEASHREVLTKELAGLDEAKNGGGNG